MKPARWLRTPALAAVAALVSGCATPAYYWQAIRGHLDVLQRAQPIPEVIAAPQTRPAVRSTLELAQRLRDYASRELGLPDNGSYRRYADIGRPYVVWNVFAAEPLSVRPKEWCFAVAGCVAYRGYYAEADARAYAERLRTEGYDVHVTGVPAYSTLGWFDDPILSSFIHYPETELARLLFHELAHQVAYAPDDSEFNESFAMTVELEGVQRWLAAHGDAAKREAFAAAQHRRQDFQALVLKYRAELEALYAGPGDAADKLAAKARVIAALRADYRALRDGPWGGFAGYDRWFGQDINNATLASIGIYSALVPGFQALLAREGRDLPRFYAAVQALAKQDGARRRALLAGNEGTGRLAATR